MTSDRVRSGGVSARASPYLERRACPLCGTPVENARPRVASRPPAENLAPLQLGPLLQGYDSRRAFFTYYQCGKCGLLYCRNFFDPSELDRLYRFQPENIADAPLEARQRTQASYFDILKSCSPLTGNYLEIGSDIGLFSELCARQGHFTKLCLYEPNAGVHEQLKKRLAGAHFVLRAEGFERSHLDAPLSTAAVIHVLDHLLEPRLLLDDIHASMSPGGILMVVVHNQHSFLARAMGTHWPPYTLQHPQLYSPRTLRALLERTGFETVSVVRTVNYFPLPFLVCAVSAAFGMPLPRWLNLPKPMVGLRFGNIAAVGRRC